jgi:hypothetical protein
MVNKKNGTPKTADSVTSLHMEAFKAGRMTADQVPVPTHIEGINGDGRVYRFGINWGDLDNMSPENLDELNRRRIEAGDTIYAQYPISDNPSEKRPPRQKSTSADLLREMGSNLLQRLREAKIPRHIAIIGTLAAALSLPAVAWQFNLEKDESMLNAYDEALKASESTVTPDKGEEYDLVNAQMDQMREEQLREYRDTWTGINNGEAEIPAPLPDSLEQVVESGHIYIPKGGSAWDVIQEIAKQSGKSIDTVTKDFARLNGIKDFSTDVMPGDYKLPEYPAKSQD